MDTKSTIINVAIQLFSEKGFEAVGIQEIVDTSGITKPTLYHFFGNKRGLLDTLLQKNYTSFFVGFEKAVEYQGDIVLTLTNVFSSFIRFYHENPAFFRLSLTLQYSPRFSESYIAIKSYEQKIREQLEQLFVKASEHHGNLKGHQQLYSISLLGLTNYYALAMLNENLVIDDSFIYKAVKHYMHGIYSL